MFVLRNINNIGLRTGKF